MRYFFILGQNPTLSSAEISSLLPPGVRFAAVSPETILLETEREIDPYKFMSRLGGTIKAGQILDTLIEIDPEEIAKNIPTAHGKKSYFGFSFYKIDDELNSKTFQNKTREIKNLAISVKNILAENKISSRWVTSTEKNLSSVVVEKNKLLTEAGAEIVFLIGKEKIYLGKTLAVQEFEELSFRDYSRPARSMKVGLLPPKLAKIMINLAEKPLDAVLLDPFVGLATILGEAALMGYKNLIGADINGETLSGARENFEWLTKTYNLKLITYNLIASDVRKLSKKLPPRSVHAIVTEPYLGPALQGNESQEKIQEIIKELSELYLSAFREFKKILKLDGKIVITFPVFHTEKENLFLPVVDEIKKIGFTVTNPLPKGFEKYSFLKITPRDSIVYSRPNQLVRREVLIFALG